MALIDAATIQRFLDVGNGAHTTAVRGRALEDLICYVMAQVPGIAITHRNAFNAFETEEVDVAVWNDRHAEGFFFLPDIVLVECKNWSNRVSSIELAWFDHKLESRGLTFGILITTLGITGNTAEMSAAHRVVAQALTKGRRLIVITADELLAVGSTDALALLIKRKMCELAVSGTVA